ncbi:uncharacterized protein [Haliotis cracherodii]|uniref:uncharacterized protein n=1 Tax=Haliotis cracherodii TaxID=6455 RepID=UPI0039EA2B38
MRFSASQRNASQGEIFLASFVRQLVPCLLAAAPIYFTLLYTSGVLQTCSHDNFREHCDWGCREHLPELPEGCQLNLLLVGKRGHGKSALGNYILGQDMLHSQQATGGLIRNAASSASNRVGERQILVVDAAGVDIPSGPGFDEDDPLMEAVSVGPGGYHAIIIVISTVVNITEEDKAALLYLPSLFGERFLKYAIFVFTHCDIYARRNSLMESSSGQAVSAHFLPTLDPKINHILKMSENRYFFVDNMDRNMFNQRLLQFGLIETVDTLVDRNKGSNYTNDDFKAAREEIYRLQKQLAEEAERARPRKLAEEGEPAKPPLLGVFLGSLLIVGGIITIIAKCCL